MSKYGYESCTLVDREDKITKEEAHRMWKVPPEKNNWKENSPEDYKAPTKRSEYFVSMACDYLNSDSNILEIGCNVGRNLEHLYESGYENLSGIEINSDAINLMKESYPLMYQSSNIFNGCVEDIIPTLKTDSYECVYTIAVLEHIHHDSEFIFEHMKRIASKYIITIEDEKTTWSDRHFPRNYQSVFEDNNWEQVFVKNLGIAEDLDDRFFARIFKKGD